MQIKDLKLCWWNRKKDCKCNSYLCLWNHVAMCETGHLWLQNVFSLLKIKTLCLDLVYIEAKIGNCVCRPKSPLNNYNLLLTMLEKVTWWDLEYAYTALFQYNLSGKCLTKVPESPLSLTALWYCQGCGKAQLLLQTCQFLMWYPAAVGSCVLKLMLGFEFLYNLPQEGKATKQSLCPPSPNLCSYIKQNFTLAVEVHYAIPYLFIHFLCKTTFWHLNIPSTSLLHTRVTFSTKHSDFYLAWKCKVSSQWYVLF